MLLRMFGYIRRWWHTLWFFHRGTTLVSGPRYWQRARYIGCECGRVFYTDVYGDPNATFAVKNTIERARSVREGRHGATSL